MSHDLQGIAALNSEDTSDYISAITVQLLTFGTFKHTHNIQKLVLCYTYTHTHTSSQ